MTGEEWHKGRAEGILGNVLSAVREDGLIYETIDKKEPVLHPAFMFTVCKCMGMVYQYLGKLGLEKYGENIKKAVVTIVEKHPDAGAKGTYGSDQSLRFEIAGYYFAYIVTGEGKYLEWYKALFNNGIYSYTHDTVDYKKRHFTFVPGIQKAVFHPDFTYNYACGSGVENSVPTNTHTPAYYIAEQDGFLYTYLHGLKNGILCRNKEWDDFCVKYARGLYKDYSRAGRASCDVDGYGLHRAWYSTVIFEGIPLVECAKFGPVFESENMCEHFNWYCERYIRNFTSSEHYKEYGVPAHQPYGHNITVENQFDIFNNIVIYAKAAMCHYELDADMRRSLEPEPFYTYSWWHNWVRISTPVYETSFVATTSGCNTPTAKYWGDPNLGTVAGGAALTTLFAGDNLLYAPDRTPDYMFDMFVRDRNGRVARSSCTLFDEEVRFRIVESDGNILDKNSFKAYEMPFKRVLDDSVTTMFEKRALQPEVTFYVRNVYRQDSILIDQSFHTPDGCFLKEGYFNLPFPGMQPLEIEYRDSTKALAGFDSKLSLDIREIKSIACRVKEGKYRMEFIKVPEYRHGNNTVLHAEKGIEQGEPGGENSFCPYPLAVMKIGVRADYLSNAQLIVSVTFE